MLPKDDCTTGLGVLNKEGLRSWIEELTEFTPKQVDETMARINNKVAPINLGKSQDS